MQFEDRNYFFTSEELGIVEHICRAPAQDMGYSRRQRIQLFKKAERLLKDTALIPDIKDQAIKSISYGVNYLGHPGVVVTCGYVAVEAKAPSGPKEAKVKK